MPKEKSSVDSMVQRPQSLFAAQPIFDVNEHRVAVELLYRSDKGVSAIELGDNQATAEIIYKPAKLAR